MLLPYDVIIYIFNFLIEYIGLLKCLHFLQLNKEINKRLKEKYQLKIYLVRDGLKNKPF